MYASYLPKSMEKYKDNPKNHNDIIEGSFKGVVKGNIFLKYFQSGSGLCVTIIMAALFILTQVFVSINDLYLPIM
jgi:hypothetical protein